MAPKTQQIAEMIDMLPEAERDFAYEMVKRIVLAWDPDFTKLTFDEEQRLKEAETSGFIPESEIDWNNLAQY